MRRILSVFTAIAMILWASNSISEQERILTIASTLASPGSSTTVQITIDDATGLAGWDMEIEYDTAMLVVEDVRGTELTAGMFITFRINVPGELAISMAGPNAIPSGSGALVEIDLAVSPDAQPGTEATLDFHEAILYDAMANPIPVQPQNGIVTITGLKGDVNEDSKIRSDDALLTLRIAAGLMMPTEYQIWAADVNEDGKVKSNDFILILRMATIDISEGTGVNTPGFHATSGSSVTFGVDVDDATGIAAFDIILEYDSEILEAKGVQLTDLANGLILSVVDTVGREMLSGAGLQGLEGSGTILEAQFDIKIDVSGDNPLAMSYIMYDELANIADVNVSVSFAGNHPPDALNVHIKTIDGTTDQEVPRDPITGDRLKASYTFHDIDGDSEAGSVIRWYRNGLVVPEEEDEVLSCTVYEDEVWYFSITPSDGKITGSTRVSPSVTVSPATGTVAGTVTDSSTGNPIESATVSAGGYSTTTDQDGNYQFSIPVGTYDLTASAPGYDSAMVGITIVGGQTYTVDFSLELTEETFSLDLNNGWNLISLPLQTEDMVTGTVLSSLGTKYNSVWAYDPVAGWTIYAPSGVSDLTEMVPGKGYWIKMDEPGTLNVQGTVPEEAAISLIGNAWNLVGYSSLEFRNAEECMSSVISDISSVWEYGLHDAVVKGWSIYAPGGPSDLEVMKPGYGYWIKADQTCEWDVDAP